MQIVTIHYNTPALVDVLIRSIRKFTDCKVWVFDNSDEEPFTKQMENVEVIDNTKGQIIDFDEFLSHYPKKCNFKNFILRRLQKAEYLPEQTTFSTIQTQILLHWKIWRRAICIFFRCVL